MQMFEDIFLEHAARYPLWQASDMLKLLYQSCLGGGHLIADPKMSLSNLVEEYRALGTPCIHEPLAQEIAGGMCRVHLQALNAGQLATLNQLFVRGAQLTRADQTAFARGLSFLEGLGDPLRDEVERYRARGCPMIGHSADYRAAYRPAYRVVPKALLHRNFALQDPGDPV